MLSIYMYFKSSKRQLVVVKDNLKTSNLSMKVLKLPFGMDRVTALHCGGYSNGNDFSLHTKYLQII